MIVMKFGGSSLAGAVRLRQVADLVIAARAQQPCVVLSAIGKTTDRLFGMALVAERGDAESALHAVREIVRDAVDVTGQLLRDPATTITVLDRMQNDLETLARGVALLRERTPRTTDAIVAHGERIATTLLTALLRERGVAAEWVDAATVMRTDATFGRAVPDKKAIHELTEQHLRPRLEAGTIVVTQGYVGAAADGATTTIGRGGSDWSAALLGEALGAEEVQIWTDVEGVLTADPRVVPDARPIAVMSADEAAELAAFGAKVLHPSTIQPAIDAGIPVTVRHTERPAGRFTMIDARSRAATRGAVAALAGRGPVTVLTMTSRRMLAASGYLARLFAVFGELGVSIDLVATAEVSVACTVEADAPVERLVQALNGLAHVEVVTGRAIVAVFGDGLARMPHVLERACRALSPIVPELVSFGGNTRNLSFVVPQQDRDAALRRLHAEFFDREAEHAPGARSTQEANR
jgi:aspartate kinase